MEKDWTEYRFDELAEKAGVKEMVEMELPEFDMDGSRFTPEYSDEEEERLQDMSLYSPSDQRL